jgi:hypothetical protein
VVANEVSQRFTAAVSLGLRNSWIGMELEDSPSRARAIAMSSDSSVPSVMGTFSRRSAGRNGAPVKFWDCGVRS